MPCSFHKTLLFRTSYSKLAVTNTGVILLRLGFGIAPGPIKQKRSVKSVTIDKITGKCTPRKRGASKLGLMQRSFSIGVLVLSVLLIVLVVDTAVGVGDYATDQEALMDGLLTGLAPLILLTCMGWQEAAMAQRCVVHRRSGGQLHLLCTGLSYSGPGRISGSAGRAPGMALCA